MCHVAFHVWPSSVVVVEVAGINDYRVRLDPVPATVKCVGLAVQVRCRPPNERKLERADLREIHLDGRVVLRASLVPRRKEVVLSYRTGVKDVTRDNIDLLWGGVVGGANFETNNLIH